MTPQQILKKICEKEIEYGCYEATINNLSLYSLIRDDVRNQILLDEGCNVMVDRNKVCLKALIPAFITSIWHLFYLFISTKKYSIVFYPFARLEKIGGVYIDKFSDPIIKACNLKDYIILDRGRAGVHPQPRAHSDRVFFIDALQVCMTIKSFVFYKYFLMKHKNEFDKLIDSLKLLTGKDVEKAILRKTVFMYYFSQSFVYILRKIKAQNVIGPARGQQKPLFIAAHQLGIKSFELQHGITYGETVPYSGYRDPIVLPNIFLAFGENNPLNVYGIDENRIQNIGFALLSLLDKLKINRDYNCKGVLVISDPQITNEIIQAVFKLAENNPNIDFYFRPHPHEEISLEQKNQINSRINVFIQDRSVNIIETLHSFNHVIGENSTVLYEALAMRKKVGKLYFPGLNPLYLSGKDKEQFWQISDQNTFEAFLKGENPHDVRSIYSPFNKEKFLNLLKK